MDVPRLGWPSSLLRLLSTLVKSGYLYIFINTHLCIFAVARSQTSVSSINGAVVAASSCCASLLATTILVSASMPLLAHV